jgi:hypothetical protein
MKGVNLTRSLREPLVLRRLGVFGLLEIAFLRLDSKEQTSDPLNR